MIYRQILPGKMKEIPVFDISIYINHDIYRYQTGDVNIENYICKIKAIL